jgi:signal transduction histidine kinase
VASDAIRVPGALAPERSALNLYMEGCQSRFIDRWTLSRDIEELITSLQAAEESTRATVARELHDDLGGLMVAAMMDLASLQGLGAMIPQQDRDRLLRIQKTLESAIDLKRRITEKLRPSILDNFGLFAALRWHLKEHCGHTDAAWTQEYPDTEPPLGPDASLAFFRIAQEALAMTLKRSLVRNSSLHVTVAGGKLLMKVSDDGTPTMREGEEIGAATALACMQYRIRVLGGTVDIDRKPGGGTVLTASMPLPAEADIDSI